MSQVALMSVEQSILHIDEHDEIGQLRTEMLA